MPLEASLSLLELQISRLNKIKFEEGESCGKELWGDGLNLSLISVSVSVSVSAAPQVMARRSFEDQEDPHCDKKNRNGPTLRNASTVGDRDRTRRVSFVFADSTNTKSADSMSLSEGLPHLFRKRTLQGRLNLLEGVDRTDRADRTPTRQESFAEGSVLFEDTDSEFADHLSARLLASSYHISRSDDEDTVITNEQFKSSYYPPEPPLPDKVKDMKWFRVFASCIVVSSNGVQYALSQFMPYVSTDLGQKCMASAISLLICFFTLG